MARFGPKLLAPRERFLKNGFKFVFTENEFKPTTRGQTIFVNYKNPHVYFEVYFEVGKPLV